MSVIGIEPLIDSSMAFHNFVTVQSVQNRPYVVSLKTHVRKLALLGFEHSA